MNSIVFRSHALGLALALSTAASAAQDTPDTAAPTPAAQQVTRAVVPAYLERQARRLETVLRARGYEVARGGTKLFTIEDCQYPIAVLGNCLGNNPASPYVIATVPLWPDEYRDQTLKNLIGPTPGNTWATYRLDRRESLIVVGQLPPPARYFGIQTYVFTHAGKINTADPIYQKTLVDPFMNQILFDTAPDPTRVVAFSSIGNSNNNVTIRRQSGAVFGLQRSFVTSTDAAMAREMTQALVHAGVARRQDVFVEPVSPQVARLGLAHDADDFMTIIRYTQPVNKKAGDAWRQDRPLIVLRVRDKNANATEPWPKPAYDPKTARSELGLAGNLSSLVNAVKQQWRQSSATSTTFSSLQTSLDLVGQHCLLRPMNCLGDTQDADYQVSHTFTLDDHKVVAVAGTLGTATGNALYVGLSVNWLSVLKGVTNLTDVDLRGTALRYARSVPGAGKFYVQYYARNCSGIPHCQAITEKMVPRGQPIKIIQRNYVVPGSARGPDPTKVLNPVAIELDGRNRPGGG